MPVKANTNYALEFWYKGEFTGEAPVWAISKGNTFAGASVLNRGTLDTAYEWSKKRVIVSSGDNKSLSSCAADVAVGITLADSCKNECFPSVKLDSRTVINRMNGGTVDVFGFILLNLNSESAESVDYIGKR